MTDHQLDHQADCLMCTVRALTEGDPAVTWTPDTEGQTISGVVLRKGNLSTDFGTIPFIDLWLGGQSRVRVIAYSSLLRHALDAGSAQVGDRLSVWFDGEAVVDRGPMRGRMVKRYSANVQRGH